MQTVGNLQVKFLVWWVINKIIIRCLTLPVEVKPICGMINVYTTQYTVYYIYVNVQ